jgi:hypothetical protein
MLNSGDQSEVEPPGPIPNPEVKRLSANGSGTIGPVRVGRRQVYAPSMVTWTGLFFAHDRAFPLRFHIHGIEDAAMTRLSIERCIYIFIVALSATFVWTVTEVLKMVGWL